MIEIVLGAVACVGVAAFFLLKSNSSSHNTTSTPSMMDPSNWQVGPVIDGVDYSHNVPLRPVKTADGWEIDIPTVDGVHYVTIPFTNLAGKSQISMSYRIEMADGVQVLASSDPGTVAIGPTLYFQRAGDNWSGTGGMEAYRWWATFASKTPIVAGSFVVIAPLSGKWTAVETSTVANNPTAFHDAVDNCARIGFTLGGGTGYGHGVYATGPAKLIVTGFSVQ